MPGGHCREDRPPLPQFPRLRDPRRFRSRNPPPQRRPDHRQGIEVSELSDDQQRDNSAKKEERAKLQHRLTSVRKHIDQAYMDKLDGTITAEFWQRMTAEWQMEEQQTLLAMQGLEHASPDTLLTAKRTLELANRAYFLYVSQPPAEQAKLLKMVLSSLKG